MYPVQPCAPAFCKDLDLFIGLEFFSESDRSHTLDF